MNLSRKRSNSEEKSTIVKKKLKNSLDVATHWKRIEKFYENDPKEIFTCKSKDECKTRKKRKRKTFRRFRFFFKDFLVRDPFDVDRSSFVVGKTSFYWLNESIRLIQNHVVFGCTTDDAINGEIIEIERNLKALKQNVEKNGKEKTFFHRAESLIHFVRFCSISFSHFKEKHQRCLRHLLNLCANSWLRMFDIVLPATIVRVQKSFLLDDDFEDFEEKSILKLYRKDEQTKIKSKSKLNEEEKSEEKSLVFLFTKKRTSNIRIYDICYIRFCVKWNFFLKNRSLIAFISIDFD